MGSPFAPPPGGSPGGAPDWARVRQVVEWALAVPGEEREAYLQATCGDDPALLEAARAMLAEDADDGYMDPPSARDFAPLLGGGEGAPPGRVGAWELRRKIGEGGMGAVWEAARADGAFRRRAAVKLVRAGLDTGEMLERFRRERQVLANLDHPGIARLLDGGATDEGVPYLVMEHVEGLSIDRYCDENRLDTAERLELFGRVCDAVEYAHRQLVVHRDLKPSNILVTPEGDPKLLDFGIAKLLDPEKTASVQVTQDVLRLMTPAYASPEQLRGRPVGTASDQYSLGVILYRLLTGHLPLAVAGRSPAELERMVTEEEPERPSRAVSRTAQVPDADGESTSVTPEEVSDRRRTSPTQLSRSLRGDLDRILLMALRKEPRRRYPSVAALAEDLRRHRAGRPVLARPDTWSYRATKFLARNRVPASLAGATILSLSVGLAIAVRQYRRADSASELAVDRLGEVQQLNRDLERERDVADGLRRTAEERLAEVERLNVDLERERALAQRRFDEVRGVATTLIFDLNDVVARLEGGTAARELILTTGLAMLDRLAAESAGDAGLQRELGDAYLRMGDVRAEHLGQTEEALACYGRAGELCRALARADAEDWQPLLRLGRALQAVGRTQSMRGDTAAGLEVLEEALEVALSLQERAPGAQSARLLEVEVRTDLASALLSAAPPEEALVQLEATQERLEELAAELPDEPEVRESLAQVHLHAGELHRRFVRWDEALAEERRAVELREGLVRDHPDRARYRRNLLLTRDALADTLMQAGDLDEALEVFVGSRERYEELLALDPADLRALRDAMIVEMRLGQLYSRRDEHGAAVEVLESSIARARRLAEADPANGLAQRELARVLMLWAAYERERLESADLSTDDMERALQVCLTHFEEAAGLQAALAPVDRTIDLAQERFACHASAGQALSALAGLPERAPSWRRARWSRAEAEFRRAIEMLEEYQRRGGDPAQAGPLIDRLERDAERCATELEALGPVD